MKKYKVLIKVSFLSLVIGFSFALVNVSYLQVRLEDESEKKSKELCSHITSGLKFCTNSQKITINSGEVIILHFSLTNMSEQEIRVKTNRDSTKYNIKVTDENGEIVLTKLEKKKRDNTHDYLTDLINSSFTDNRSEFLKAEKSLNEKFVLSSIYDFTLVGKYYVEITRKTMNPNGEGFIELPLEKIEIEVK